jgi:hypothetical protein
MKTEITLEPQTAAAITLESLIEKAHQILDLAIAEKQFSAAVAALQEVGTLSGLRIERREVGASLNRSALIFEIKKNHDVTSHVQAAWRAKKKKGGSKRK